MLNLANRLQRTGDLDAMLEELLPSLCSQLDWEFAALWVAEGAGDRLRCRATWEPPHRPAPELRSFCASHAPAPGEGVVGACWDSAEAVVDDATQGALLSEAELELVRSTGMHSALAVPLVGARGRRGVVLFLSRLDRPQPEETGELLTAVGNQIGLFFDRVEDAEESRRREQELHYQTALLTAQIDSAPQAVLAVSDDRRVLACNRRFEELWGLAPGSVKPGDPSPALQDPTLVQVKDPDAFEEALKWGHTNPGEVQELDVPLVDGRVIQGIASPIVDDSGTYFGRIWFLTDDTERRRAEAERSELLQRLQRSQRSQAFLLDASRVLAGASGYIETLERLAAVAVPTLGDICLIDVVGEDGALERKAARHADPRRQPLVDELRRRFAPDPLGMHPSVDVTQSRRSRWSPEMTDAFLRATCRDAEHFGLVKQLGFTSYMTVPLVAVDEVLGTVTLVSAGSGRRFGPEDLALAEDLADRVAQVVAKARRYDDEHHLAHTLQANLLPAGVPEIPGLRLARRYEASPRGAEVGGDWFDVVALPGGAVRFSVGDVAGHDMAAAAAMAQLRSACRALTPHAPTPAALLQQLRSGWEHLGVERMVTMVVAQIDPGSGALEVASAGHPAPLVVHAGGAGFLPVQPEAPLGAPATSYDPWTGRLERGSTLLLYTDGLVEERQRPLGPALDRLAALAAGLTDPEALCDHLLERVPLSRDDDIALLALSLDPSPPD